MKFGIEKCAMLIMKTGKRKTVEGMELPFQKSIRMFGEKDNNKYLGMLPADTIKK